MILYLARHAEAVELGGVISRDAERPLTTQGEQDATLMGRVLSRLESKIGVVMASPLLRARQTAEHISRELGTHPKVRVSEHLAPGFRPKVLLEELLSQAQGSDVVAVGHQPDLGMFVAFLIGDSSRAAITMEPGAIAKLRLTSTDSRVEARLSSLFTPAAVRKLDPTL
jgi:phosphohistidine phosphatase